MISRICLLSQNAAKGNLPSLMVLNCRYKGSKSGGSKSVGSKPAAGGSKSGGSTGNSNKSNQMNPNNSAYFKSHGWGSRPESFKDHTPQKGNNRAEQMNPNNPKGGYSSGTQKK